jgi:hypothetical protein
VVVAAACGDNVRGNISIHAPGQWRGVFLDFITFTQYRGLVFGDDGDFRIEVVQDPAIPAEGYRIDRPLGANADETPVIYTVAARDILGAQYGTAAVLEDLGFRFRHPYDPYLPAAPKPGTTGLLDNGIHQPDVRVRGLHLHTLHPIESYFAFWEPAPGNSYDAHRIIDWIVKNRGNYVQFAPLDNIMDPMEHDKWLPFAQDIIKYAHARGVRIGIEIQLFGNSNLQRAFDLYDDRDFVAPVGDSVAKRLPLITQDLPFDVYDLSFGEFFSADPQKFIDSVNEVARQLRVLAPQAEMHTLIHVGATERITYMNRDMLYYFLVQYADPTIIPDIHTVMYYNLYDDAGGAYQHDDFSEHRQYLLDRMCAGLPAGYHPETGYWVAFDNSIPTFMPVYVYSRWRDLDGLRREGCGPLDEHNIFSTGWEWGYWLNDYTTLRASYELKDPAALIADAYAPDLGPDAAALVNDLANEQKRALIDQRLAAYLASRDVSIEVGYKFDPPIISQPKRLGFDEVSAPGFDLAAFEANVLSPLRAHADAVAAIEAKLAALELPDSRWSRELRQGITIDRLRTQFIHALYSAVVAKARGGSPDADVARAHQLFDEAKPVIAARHHDLHDTHRSAMSGGTKPRLVDRAFDYGLYQYGYLYNADTMCFWNRELIEVGNLFGTTSEQPPGCLF